MNKQNKNIFLAVKVSLNDITRFKYFILEYKQKPLAISLSVDHTQFADNCCG